MGRTPPLVTSRNRSRQTCEEISENDIIAPVNRKHAATLERIFARPSRANVRWADVEALFRALGATISEGRGSRIRVEIEGHRAVFHRPHPSPYTDKGALSAVRLFLETVGVQP